MSTRKRLWMLLQLKREQIDAIRPQCAFEKSDEECSIEEAAARVLYDEISRECDRLDAQIEADEILQELRR